MKQEFISLALHHINVHGGRYTVDLLDREVGAHHTEQMTEGQLKLAVEVLKADTACLTENQRQRAKDSVQREEIRAHNARIDNIRQLKRSVKRKRREAAGR